MKERAEKKNIKKGKKSLSSSLPSLKKTFSFQQRTQKKKTEALHSNAGNDNRVVSKDHTTLLVSCYAALRDGERLEAFLKKVTLRSRSGDDGDPPPSTSSSRSPPSPALPLDARAAFDVCRSAGFSSAARSIAKAAGEHEWFVDVLLDDATAAAASPAAPASTSSSGSSSSTAKTTKDDGASSSSSSPSSPSAAALAAAADEALAYCASLSRKDAASVARRHGRALLAARPEAATALLMRLCTPSPETGEPAAMALADAAPLYGGIGVGSEEKGGGGGKIGEASAATWSTSSSKSSSRAALTLLCEFVLNSSLQPPRDPSLYHTLLQLYLSEGEEEEKGGKDRKRSAAPRRRDDALALLSRGWLRSEPDDPRYDPDTVLLLCRRFSSSSAAAVAADAGGGGWHEGQLFVHERRGAFREAMGVLAAAGDHRGVVATALRHGGLGVRVGGRSRRNAGDDDNAPSASSSAAAEDPGLIPLALEYVAGLDDDAARPCAVELLSSLMVGAGGDDVYDEKRVAAATSGGGGGDETAHSSSSSSSALSSLVPPIVAIDILSRNPRITLGDVKPFVAAALAADGRRAAADAAEAASLRASAAAARAAAAKLATEPTVFQATRCAASGAPLELPTVHFLCGHSFNAEALRGGGGGGRRSGSSAARAAGAAAGSAAAPAALGQKQLRSGSSSCTECPLCGPGSRALAASASAAAAGAAGEGGRGQRQRHWRGSSDLASSSAAAAAADKFFSALRAAPDGFDAVADWVGRGLFAATRG